MSKRRIEPVEIAIGSALSFDAYDAHGRLLLRKGQIINSRSQIDGLMERGLFVLDGGVREKQAQPRQKPAEVPPSAVSLVLEARRRLQAICAVDAPKEGFSEVIFGIRELIREACTLSQDAALAMTLLEREGRYSIRHSVDVAIACHVVGTALDIQEPELSALLAAALTMNMSILKLQDDLQSQAEPLSEEQREIIRRHPEDTVAILQERGVTNETWLGALLSHHEAIDGSGYRHGKTGDDIPLFSQLVSLADVYCARISSRDYRPPLRPNAALRALFLDQGKKVRDGLASQFIKAIGVFPPGTPVRLENGEMAVVTQRGESAKSPQVCAIIGPRGMPLVKPIPRDTSMPTYGVREVVDWSEIGAPPSMSALWGKVATVN
jgi:HD-GYP domain-containing protein (c-di-GMP phosphodiesterase class II)